MCEREAYKLVSCGTVGCDFRLVADSCFLMPQKIVAARCLPGNNPGLILNRLLAKLVQMRILLVEDDRRTVDYVARGFEENGHRCDTVAHGTDGLIQATRESYDVLVIDRMLPGLDGLSLVKAIRAVGVMTPVLFLTAVGGVDDRVEGLESGADDYLVKPFAFSE